MVTWKRAAAAHARATTIVAEALCFGWIDSRPRSTGTDRSALVVTPRKPTSNWSRINKQRVAALTAAQANGSWHALNQVESLTEPADLTAALYADPAARQHWDAFARPVRRAILEWSANARTGATRYARIEQTARDAACNIRASQWRQPKRART